VQAMEVAGLVGADYNAASQFSTVGAEESTGAKIRFKSLGYKSSKICAIWVEF